MGDDCSVRIAYFDGPVAVHLDAFVPTIARGLFLGHRTFGLFPLGLVALLASDVAPVGAQTQVDLIKARRMMTFRGLPATGRGCSPTEPLSEICQCRT